MNKPEKKSLNDIWNNQEHKNEFLKNITYERAVGYNQACEDWEKWLPSEEEIIEILRKIPSTKIPIGLIAGKKYYYMCKEDIAKAISKRLRGKK